MARIDLQRAVSCNFPSSWQELSRTLKKGEMKTSEMGSSRFGHDVSQSYKLVIFRIRRKKESGKGLSFSMYSFT